MIRKKIVVVLSAIIALILIYLCFFTNVIFNHSCVGITYYSGSGVTEMDILVKYFESETKAKRFYKENNITHFVLAASDYSENGLNTKDWFSSIEYPLIEKNRKICTINYVDDIFDSSELLTDWLKSENLMVYHISDSLSVDSFNGQKDSTYDPTGGAMTFVGRIHKDYTKSEKEYITSVIMYGLGLCESLDCYKISIESNDEFSKAYWEIQIIDYFDKLQNITMPSIIRENPNWNEINIEFSDRINNIYKTFVSEKNNVPQSTLFSSSKLAFESWILTNTFYLDEKPGKIIEQVSGGENSVIENNTVAETIRKHIRENCDGTYKDAKRIFEEEYVKKEFLLEYFFTDKELKTIEELENNGENKIFYETYDQGWVEVVSLIGEIGDEVVYIGEQDPFVENFVWE